MYTCLIKSFDVLNGYTYLLHPDRWVESNSADLAQISIRGKGSAEAQW